MTQILIKNLSKSFDSKQILDNVNLIIEEGKMIALLGPSGCGKTTTLKIIAGIIPPDRGEIYFNGQSILNVPVEKRGAVIVFQDHLLFPHLTVEENVGFGLKMAKVDKKQSMERIRNMIHLVQLEGQEKKYPRELSGGQRQRVAIARALAIEPKVMLLDEPFSNLDLRLRESMREFICDIQRKMKITTVLVTHDKEEALMTSDKVAVMLEGKVRQFDTPTQLYQNPNSPEVADFFGEKNYILGKIENGYFLSSLGCFPTSFNKYAKVRAMIKPEEIKIREIHEQDRLEGEVIFRQFAGDRTYYTILINNMKLKCMNSSRKIFDVHEKVSIDIDFNRIVFFEEENETL